MFMKNKAIIPYQTAITRAMGVISYLTPEEVLQLTQAASSTRNGERDALLIKLLFQTGLRISEALSLTPQKLGKFEGRPALEVLGKGKKTRMVACPGHLAEGLQAYAYRKQLNNQDRFFPINRIRAFQIIKQAGQKAGLNKRVFPHLLRHSDAIERLRRTGNPKALQHHLGHSSTLMVMRYLSTLTQEDSLRIQQDVEFE